jgi:general nucleoside transport system permease protein
MIAFLIISFVSEQPLTTIGIFIFEPILSIAHIGNVIEMAIPLTFAGLATALLFRTGLFNLGSEGIFYISGITAAAIAIFLNLNDVLHPLVAILAGGLVGALIATIVGVMKAKWNANELVTSLMFNSILLGVGLYILNYHLRDAKAFSTVSFKFEPTALLSKFIPGTRIHSGLLIVILIVIATHYFLYKTKWGYELRMTGVNREFTEYSGINTIKVIILVHALAGFIAGIGGSVEILGMYTRFQWTALPGYGFDGALVAMLAKNKPLNVIAAALFLSYIRIGADLMARMSDVPAEMISIIQAIIILLISAELFLRFLKNRMLLKEAGKNE